MENRYRKELQRNLLAEPGQHAMQLVLNRLKPGFGVANILRSSEVFSVARVHLVGIGAFDPAPAKGGLRKVPVSVWEEFAPCHAALNAEGYSLFSLDPGAALLLGDASLPAKSAFIFGHEEFGSAIDRELTPQPTALKIPQFGQTESLNVGTAAAIVMYDYCNRLRS